MKAREKEPAKAPVKRTIALVLSVLGALSLSFPFSMSSGGVALLSASPLLAGCSRSAPDATPEGAVRMFLDRMEAASSGAAPMSEVFTLLGPATRKNLTDRASRAGRIQGRRIEPADMLAPGRYALKFRPKAMTARVDGDTAVVSVTGYESSESAEVTLVRENGVYKVELDLPDVMPLPFRNDAGAR